MSDTLIPDDTASGREVVVVSRQWHEPTITVGISLDGISIAMPLEDFVAALLAEVGSPALTMTRAQLAAKVTEAAARVVTGMKAETARVW